MSAPIRRSVFVGCAAERAFVTFTDRIDAWWPPGHRTLAGSRIGFEADRLVERTAEAESELGRVVAWEPPNLLSYTWRPGAPAGTTTLVVIRFVPDGDGTRVHVEHGEGASGLGDAWPTRAERFDRSWERVLAAFVGWTAAG
ncbi:MAG: SRPBCC domain-containing protein [Myxococcota bacterium]